MAEIRRSQAGDRVVLTVSGELTVPHAKALKAELLDALKNAAAVEVAVEQVSGIDISFPQLLCAAHRAAAGLNKQMTITGAEQEPFGKMLRSAGFTRHIGCQEGTRRPCLWLHGSVSE
jgi:ABC-type transporter Mla MlaB component